jgi:enediyne biosynthesis protein E4
MRLSSAVPCLLLAAAGITLPALPAAQHGAAPQVVFRDGTDAAGLDMVHVNGASAEKHFPEIMGSGGLFFDFDNDGWIDLFLVDGGSFVDPAVARRARHRLYRNRGDGTFEDVTARAGIVHRDYGMGACAADVDNDGRVDLYVTTVGANVLYRNNGDGTFTDVSREAGVGAPLWSTSCAFADLDGSGHVDLFVTSYVAFDLGHNPFCGTTSPPVRSYCHPLNYEPLPSVLYRNNGDGTFTDISERAGISAHRSNGLGVVIADIDDDGLPDVFVANDALPDFLFRNLGDGRFEEVALLAGVAVGGDGRPRAGMGVAFGDYAGDGRPGLVVTNHEYEMHSLFRNLGRLLFADATVQSGVGQATRPYVGFGVAFLDYDNDGHLDLAIVNGHVIDHPALMRPGATLAQRNLLLRNLGSGRFTDVSERSGPGLAIERVSRLLAVADIDNDGDLDLLVTNNGGRPDLLVNDGGNRQPSLLVRTIGTTSNRDGIGARLRLTAGGRTLVREVTAGSSYLGQHDPRVHFGLGDLPAPDRLEIQWPSGQRDVIDRPPLNVILTVEEGTGITARVPLRR